MPLQISDGQKPLQIIDDKKYYKNIFFFVTSIKALAFKYFYTIEISNNPPNFSKVLKSKKTE